MISRESRDRLALALRRYVSCRISNDELHEIPVDARDRGALAVKHAAWMLYSDLKNHFNVGKYELSPLGRREVARLIVYLHSNVEYQYPDWSLKDVALSLLTLGWWKRVRSRDFEKVGDMSAWPFVRSIDVETAAKRFFAGHTNAT
jgi:hypothetical protein